MGKYPEVKIVSTTKKKEPVVGMAGRIGVIGAFDSEVNTLQSFTNLEEAKEALGTDDDFKGCTALPYLFRDDKSTNGILVANITTWTGDTPAKTLTSEKLADALNLLATVTYDILYVAEDLDDTALTAIKTALDQSYSDKKPAGLITCVTRASKTALLASAGKFEDGGLYGMTDQPVIIGNKTLTAVETGAYYTGLIAGLELDKSMTMKQLPDVTGLAKEYTFEENSDGRDLVSAGVTVFKCLDPFAKKFVVVNSEQPSGLDLYVERTKDYIIKQFQLEDYLGEQSRSKALKAIESRLETLKDTYVRTFELLEDIKYRVEKKSSSCVEVHITQLIFAGIITEIDIYLNLEVV